MAPLPPGAHAGQHGLDHRDRPEDVGREQRGDVRLVPFLDGGAVPVTGVVHQDVDPAEPLLALPDRRRDLSGSVTSSATRQGRVRVGLGEIPDRVGVARGDDGVVAGVEDGLGECAAEAARAAGDEPGGHVSP